MIRVHMLTRRNRLTILKLVTTPHAEKVKMKVRPFRKRLANKCVVMKFAYCQ